MLHCLSSLPPPVPRSWGFLQAALPCILSHAACLLCSAAATHLHDLMTLQPQAAKVAKALYDMGCYEISISDTIGVGTPASIAAAIAATAELVPREKLAVHLHDT